MKVSPVAGNTLGSVTSGSNSSVTPDKREAAKKAFLGQSQNTISESDTPVDESIQAQERNIRKIRMNTNASPDRFSQELVDDPNPQNVAAQDHVESPLSDNDKQGVESEVTRPISPQFAELARQRRALQVKEREIAAKEKSFAEKSSTSNSIDLEKLRANPLSILQQAGVTYEQLTEAILADQTGINPEVQALKEQINKLEKGVEEKFQTRETQAEEAALSQMLDEAESLAKEGDSYEMIRERKAYDKILRQIYTHYKKTGQVLDVKGVMDQVEQQFLDEALKFASFKKVQSKLTPAQETQQFQQQKLRTLTNRDTAVNPISAKARAIAAFNGTFKK